MRCRSCNYAKLCSKVGSAPSSQDRSPGRRRAHRTRWCRRYTRPRRRRPSKRGSPSRRCHTRRSWPDRPRGSRTGLRSRCHCTRARTGRWSTRSPPRRRCRTRRSWPDRWLFARRARRTRCQRLEHGQIDAHGGGCNRVVAHRNQRPAAMCPLFRAPTGSSGARPSRGSGLTPPPCCAATSPPSWPCWVEERNRPSMPNSRRD